jgi:hypothetical protein
MFYLITMLGDWLFGSSYAETGKRSDKKVRDDPPTFFIVYSSNGNEKFQAECSPMSREVVNCSFVGTRVNPPRNNETLNPYDKLSDEEKKQVEEDSSKVSLSKDDQEAIRKLEHKLFDPSIGPKTKEFLKALIAAYKEGDVVKVSKLHDEQEARTCGVFVQTFSLEFKKIGPRKWLSNPGPGGLCQIVKIYELTRAETHDLWQMTETRVTAGFTEGMCKDVPQALYKPTVWSWNNPQVYELSCEFMKFDTFMPH